MIFSIIINKFFYGAFIICAVSAITVHAQKTEEPGSGGMMFVYADGKFIRDTFQVTFVGKTNGEISKEEIKNDQRLLFKWKGEDSTWTIKSWRLMIYGKNVKPYNEISTTDSLSASMVSHLMQASAGSNFTFQVITLHSPRWQFTSPIQPMTFTLKD